MNLFSNLWTLLVLPFHALNFIIILIKTILSLTGFINPVQLGMDLVESFSESDDGISTNIEEEVLRIRSKQ